MVFTCVTKSANLNREEKAYKIAKKLTAFGLTFLFCTVCTLCHLRPFGNSGVFLFWDHCCFWLYVLFSILELIGRGDVSCRFEEVTMCGYTATSTSQFLRWTQVPGPLFPSALKNPPLRQGKWTKIPFHCFNLQWFSSSNFKHTSGTLEGVIIWFTQNTQQLVYCCYDVIHSCLMGSAFLQFFEVEGTIELEGNPLGYRNVISCTQVIAQPYNDATVHMVQHCRLTPHSQS